MRKSLLAILLTLALLVTLPVLGVSATEDASADETVEASHPHDAANYDHCVCGGSAVNVYDHGCADTTWQPWPEGVTSFGSLDSGNYYLTGDVAITAAGDLGSSSVQKTVSVCLNGYNMTSSTTRVVGYIWNGSVLNFCDCSGTQDAEGNWTWDGTVTAGTGSGKYGGIFYQYYLSTANIYGGNFTGLSTNAVNGSVFIVANDNASSTSSAANAAVFNMYNGNVYASVSTTGAGGTIGSFHASQINIHGGTVSGGRAGTAGGNIANSGANSKLTVTGGTVTGGTSTTTGGNIYARNLTVTGGTVTGGTSTTAGGNIYVISGGSAEITGGTVTGGTATTNGGNIYAYSGSTVTISGGSITAGSTNNGSGGNIAVVSATLTMTGGTVSGGQTTKGGGGNIYVSSTSNEPAVVSISDASISDGKAANGYNGGNIRINNAYTTVTVSRSTITGGSALGSASGGNIYTVSPMTVTDSVISGGASSRGGNIYTTKDLTIIGSTVSGGRATAYASSSSYEAERGGGNVFQGGGTLTIGAGTRISDGQSLKSCGGNIYLAVGTMEMSDGILSGGTAGKGGSLYAAADTTVNLTGGTVTGGTATGSDENSKLVNSNGGGNIFLQEAVLNIREGATVEKGKTNYSNGGNIFVDAGTVNMTGGTVADGDSITENTNSSNDYKNGGNVNLNGAAVFTLTGGTVTGGTGREGGNFRVGSGAELNISDTACISNGTARNGGNINNYGTVNMTGGTVTGGTADANGGNFQCFRSASMNATVTLSGGTVSDGTAGVRGGNIYVAGAATNYGIGYFVMTGGTVTGGTAKGTVESSGGGNIFVNSLGNAVLTGGTVLDGVSLAYGHNIAIYQGTNKASLTIAPAEGSALVITGGEGGSASISVFGPTTISGAPSITDIMVGGPYLEVSDLTVESPVALSLEQAGVFATADTDKTASFTCLNGYPVYYDGQTGELYTAVAAVVDGEYKTFTVQQAIDMGGIVALGADCAEELTLNGDLYLDLAGFAVTGSVSGEGTLYGYDSTSDGYVEGTGIITGPVSCRIAPNFRGAAETIGSAKRYMTVQTEAGYTFHRFYLGLTHTTIKPGTTGVGYKAVFYANDTVKELLTGYGYTLELDGGFGPVFASKDGSSFISGKTVTLRVDNYDIARYGTADLTAFVFLSFSDGTVIESASVTRNMKGMLETVNSNIKNLTEGQITALQAMITANQEAMADWAVADIVNWDASAVEDTVSLDGKRVIFIGNSYIYYGGTVNENKQTNLTQESRLNDVGYFYQLCKANGEDVAVTNWTFGGHTFADLFEGNCNADRGCDGVDHLSYLTDRNYDYVVLSASSGVSSDENFAEHIETITALFREANPDVQFVYLCHTSTHGLRLTGVIQPRILNQLKVLEEAGFIIVDWGKIPTDLASGAAVIEGSALEFDFYSFIVRKSETDGYHPNQLSGYITTLMTYCAITGKSPVGQPYSFVGDTSLSDNAWNLSIEDYIAKYYCYEDYTTNYDQVFASETEVTGLQKLIEQYLTEKPYLTYDYAVE